MDVIEPCIVCVNGGRYRFFESDIWSAENNLFETCFVENNDFQPFNDYSGDEEFDESLVETFDGCNAGELDNFDVEKVDVSNAEAFDDFIAGESDKIMDRKSKNTNEPQHHDFKEEETTDIHVVALPKSGYIHTFIVNKRFYPIIVGRGGVIKKTVEFETNTVIVVPRADEDDEVSIKGPSKEAVILARRRMDMIVHHAKRIVGNTENLAPFSSPNARNIDSSNDRKFGESSAKKPDGCNAGEFDDSDATKLDRVMSQKRNNANDPKVHDYKKEETTDIRVVALPKSGYMHTFAVNKRFYPIIVGRGGDIKKKVEIETNTAIVVPRVHENDEVSIKGPTRDAVISARRQIDMIVNNAKRYVGSIEAYAPSPATNAGNIDSSDGPRNAQIQNKTRASSMTVANTNNSCEDDGTPNPDRKIMNSINSSEVELKNTGSASNQPIKNCDYSSRTEIKSHSTSNQTIKTSIPPSVPPRKYKYTHFISIPMTSETVKSNFLKFTNALLDGASKDFPGVRKDIFKKPAKLHVALSMLSLPNDEAVKAAAVALEECKQTIIKPIMEEMGPIIIRAQGLKGAFFEPHYIRVLYAQILTKNNVLPRIAQKIENFFVCAGLMERPGKKLEIHMTLMNSSFDQQNPQKKFRARNILRDYENYFFGEIELSTICISKRGEYAEDGYYLTTAKTDVP